MARTMEQIVQEQLGNLALQNAKLLTDLGVAVERNQALEAEIAKLKTEAGDPPAKTH